MLQYSILIIFNTRLSEFNLCMLISSMTHVI